MTLSRRKLLGTAAAATALAQAGRGEQKAARPVAVSSANGLRAVELAVRRMQEGADPLEYQDGIPQALRLMNSPMLNNGGRALEEATKAKTPAQAIDHLYLATLSRHPTAQENERLLGYVKKQNAPRSAYSDILWSLLNSSEFRLNH